MKLLLAPPDTAPWLNLRVEGGRIAEIRLLVGENTKVADDNVDVELVLRDGSVRLATFVSLENIKTLMTRWTETGEYGGGRYLFVPDMIVLRELTPEAVLAAAEALGDDPALDALPLRPNQDD